MSAVAHATLRANPGYELVLLERLSATERDALGDGDGLYGLLRPRPGERLDVRSACADTALLFLTLGEPAALPSYVRGRLGGETDRAVARLVLDGVLEIEHAGGYASGAQAGELVLGDRSSGGRATASSSPR